MLQSIFIATKMPMAYYSLLVQWWQTHPNHFVWGKILIVVMVIHNPAPLSPSDCGLLAVVPVQTLSCGMELLTPRQESRLSPHHSVPEQSHSLSSSLASSLSTPQKYLYSSTGSNLIPLQCLKTLTLILLRRLLSWKFEPKPPLYYVNIIAQDFIFPKG